MYMLAMQIVFSLYIKPCWWI